MALNHRIPWYRRKPLLKDSYLTDLQNGSYVASIYTLVILNIWIPLFHTVLSGSLEIESIFMIALNIFDVYCLAEASPGTTHYRFFGVSFLFVYSGNLHVRNLLIAVSITSFALAVYLSVSSVILMKALRKENEKKFRHWLIAIVLFTIWRFIAILFRSIANDMYFGYHQAMLIIWLILIVANVYFALVVLSNYQELSNITRLEDMAKLKVGTVSSLNASLSRNSHSVESMKNAQHMTSTPKGSTSTSST